MVGHGGTGIMAMDGVVSA